jgi:hypothetical protein
MGRDILAFSRVNRTEGGRSSTLYSYACQRCPAVWEYTSQNITLAPDFISKRASRDGWEAPAFRGRVRCPACQQSSNRKGERPGEKPMTKPEAPLAQAPRPVPREPTGDERFRIRGLLDSHFDDKVGAYLGDWSDQRIGTELNLPWAIVAKIREAAYGPIRVDPEMAKLTADHAELKARLTKAQEAVAARQKADTDLLGTLLEDITNHGERIAALAAKRRNAA